MRFHLLFVILALVLTYAEPSFAASSRTVTAPTPEENIARKKQLEQHRFQRLVQKYKRSYSGNEKRYATLVSGLYKDPINVEHAVRSLRGSYAQTTFYTPFSDKVIDTLTRHAYVMDTSDDIAEVNDATRAYKDLLGKHIVNYDVLLYALNLSRADPKYGNTMFLTRVRDAIRDQLKVSHHFGSTPDKAYRIYSYGEETYVLNQYAAVVEGSDVYKVDRRYFNVHDLRMPDGTLKQIYVNVTAPILNVQILQAALETQNVVDLPAQ